MAAAADTNMDAKLQKMQQRWNNIKIQIGYALVPALERLIPWLEKVAERVSRLFNNNGRFAAILMGMAGGAGLIAAVTAPVITAVASLTTTVAYLGYMSKKAAAETTLASSMIGGGGKGL